MLNIVAKLMTAFSYVRVIEEDGVLRGLLFPPAQSESFDISGLGFRAQSLIARPSSSLMRPCGTGTVPGETSLSSRTGTGKDSITSLSSKLADVRAGSC